LEIRNLALKLNVISESARLALQGWKEVLKQENSLEEYVDAKEEFIKEISFLEKEYDNLAFKLLIEVRQAEEFLNDEELDNLKMTVGNDICCIFLAWDQYKNYKDKN